MGFSVLILSLLTIYWNGWPFREKDFTLRAVFIGLGSAFLLYVIFYLGNIFSPLLFPFAKRQITAIYGFSSQGNVFLILLFLLFLTSPGEEIFWRFFLQSWAMDKYGKVKGYLLISLIYSAVHLVTGNLMLVLAALIAGLFWGFIYLREKNLVPLIISHALWTVAIFLLFPLS